MRIDAEGAWWRPMRAIFRHIGTERRSRSRNGLPLGLAPDADYEGTKFQETKLQLKPEDTLTFLSDGVVEVRNQAGELFEFERTKTISRQPAEK
jgi:serine phosphatase RsbU (regulator of sigma subunit)